MSDREDADAAPALRCAHAHEAWSCQPRRSTRAALAPGLLLLEVLGRGQRIDVGDLEALLGPRLPDVRAEVQDLSPSEQALRKRAPTQVVPHGKLSQLMQIEQGQESAQSRQIHVGRN